MGWATTCNRVAARTLLCCVLALATSYCVTSSRSYALSSALAGASTMAGSVSVERVDGGVRLLVLQLRQLPAPERISPGLTSFVVWLLPPSGGFMKAGALDYDRDHRSGSLFATTKLPSFTVQVTGERDPAAETPSSVLLAERTVSID